MKRFKIIMMAFALFLGIGSAFAFSEKHPYQGNYHIYVQAHGGTYFYSEDAPGPLVTCSPNPGAACELNTNHDADYFNASNRYSFPPLDPFGGITGASIIYIDEGNVYK